MTSANTMILHALQEMVCAEKNISRGDKEKALGHIKLGRRFYAGNDPESKEFNSDSDRITKKGGGNA